MGKMADGAGKDANRKRRSGREVVLITNNTDHEPKQNNYQSINGTRSNSSETIKQTSKQTKDGLRDRARDRDQTEAYRLAIINCQPETSTALCPVSNTVINSIQFDQHPDGAAMCVLASVRSRAHKLSLKNCALALCAIRWH